jgi:hypothetical protein
VWQWQLLLQQQWQSRTLLSSSSSLPLPLSPYVVYKLLARVHHVDQCPGSLGGAWLELP